MSEMKFNAEALGVWTDEVEFTVGQDRLVEYALATNDPIAAHVAGDVASPVFAIVPVFEAMLEPAIEVVPLQLFGKIVHGEQDFRFHRAIKPGDVLTSRAKMAGYQSRPNGSTLVIFIECRDGAGELVNEQYVTCFVRGFDCGEAVGEPAPSHRIPDSTRDSAPVAKLTQHVDEDQTFRYSPAAGDPVPIHLDEQVALDAGLPGIIAHGLCMQAFASWAVLTEVGESDVTRLRRLAVRFAKMVRPGDDLTTTIWHISTSDGVASYGFETTVNDVVVLSDGIAELAI